MSRLAFRIFLAFLCTLLITALGAIAVTSWLISERRSASESELIDAAQRAATALASGGVPGLTSWARERSQDRESSLEILVVDDAGHDLLNRPLPPALPVAAEVDDDLWGSDFPAVLLTLPQSSPELISDEGEAFRLLAVPKRKGFALWREVPLPVILLSLAVTLLMSFLLARSITRPVLDLQRTTELLANGSLDTRVPEGARRRSDEIGRLARSLDVMAVRLERLIRGQQQLLRDISHEVRSPLTRIRLASGLLVQRDASAVAAVNRIDDEVARLDELIDRILDVSRLESGAVTWHRESIDLNSLVERIVTDAVFEAEQLGKTLKRLMPVEMLPITGDRHWVESAIENVIRNALKHTPQGTSIDVVLDRHESSAELIVADSGGGVPEGDETRIFEPFYRSSGAMARSSSGSGLGLAIAARVVLEHGGVIEARNRRDDTGRVIGLEIRMRWPLATASVS